MTQHDVVKVLHIVLRLLILACRKFLTRVLEHKALDLSFPFFSLSLLHTKTYTLSLTYTHIHTYIFVIYSYIPYTHRNKRKLTRTNETKESSIKALRAANWITTQFTKGFVGTPRWYVYLLSLSLSLSLSIYLSILPTPKQNSAFNAGWHRR